MFLASTMHTRIAFVASCIGLYDHYATLTARQLLVQRSSDHFCVCDDQSKCLCKVYLVSNQTQKDGVLLMSAISTMVYMRLFLLFHDLLPIESFISSTYQWKSQILKYSQVYQSSNRANLKGLLHACNHVKIKTFTSK